MADLIPFVDFGDFLEGLSSTKYLGLSSFVLVIYDHLTCLDQEFEYFWGGEWELTSVLYFLNRYTPYFAFIVQLIYTFTPNLPLSFCTAAMKTSMSLLVFGMCVVEAILVTRVYYLWTHNFLVRCLVCVVYLVCTSLAVGYAAKAIAGIKGALLPSELNQVGCIDTSKGTLWPIFVPAFIIQTVLFFATVVRILRPMKAAKDKTIGNRLLRDGAIFYCAVLISITFSLAGSIHPFKPKIALPAVVSNCLLAYHSISASHLILSIHSLAADMGSDPTFLLSNIEISRIAWRPGKNANELIVELGNEESCPTTPLELVNLDPLAKDGQHVRVVHGVSRVHNTHIGTLHTNNSRVDLAARMHATRGPGI